MPNFPNKIIFLKKFLFKDPNANLNKLEEVEKSILKYKNKILGGILIISVSFFGISRHAIAFTFCQNKIQYCNTWGKPCGTYKDLHKELDILGYSLEQIYFYTLP